MTFLQMALAVQFSAYCQLLLCALHLSLRLPAHHYSLSDSAGHALLSMGARAAKAGGRRALQGHRQAQGAAPDL